MKYILFWTVLGYLFFHLKGCGAPIETKTVTTRETCETVVIEKEPPAEPLGQPEIPEPPEVNSELLLAGNFCGRTFVSHEGVFYMAHSGLMPLLSPQTIKVGNKCKVKYDGETLIEKRRP